MLSTVLISFREFIESMLVVGILLGFSKRFSLGKEKQIIGGAITGLIGSLSLVLISFILVGKLHAILPEEQLEIFEHILLVVSGTFLIIITFLLHPLFSKNKNNHLDRFMKNTKQSSFSFMLVSFLLVLQEGVEIVLFTSSLAFNKSFYENMMGLVIGFIGALVATVFLYKTYLHLHIQKLFRITEYVLVGFGIYLIFTGGKELLELYHFTF
ncbi:FTR1 family protein [Candidatus Roizmanbacteria bacterium]|nr:FTR1 family protein [Candidatus Roizmanbacteria bacterium]